MSITINPGTLDDAELVGPFGLKTGAPISNDKTGLPGLFAASNTTQYLAGEFYPAKLAEHLGMLPVTGPSQDLTDAGMKGPIQATFTQDFV